MNVKETHWHKTHEQAYEHLSSSLPAVLETETALWQRRVDRQKQTQYTPKKYLCVVSCQKYATRPDGVFAPAEPSEIITLLIASDGSREAYSKAKLELSAHGYNPDSFSYGISGPSIMILS